MVKAPIKLHKFQSAAWNSTKRLILMLAGTQGGKTFLGALWLQRECEKDLTADYLILAPTYKILQQATMRKFFEHKYLPGKWNEQRKEFVFPQGGRIFFRSGERPDTLESMTLKAAWMDEAGSMKQKVFPIVFLSRLGFHNGRLLMTTTPYTFNWLYWDVYVQIKNGKLKDATLVEFTTFDNPYYPKQNKDQLRIACGSDNEYRKRFLGQFSKSEGLVYPDFSRNQHLCPHEPFDGSYERFCGIDFGYTEKHPTAFVQFVKDRDGTFWVETCWKSTKSLIRDYAELIKDTMINPQQRIWGDPAAAQELAELAAYGLNITGSSRVHGAAWGRERVGRLLRSNKLKILDVPENMSLVDEFESHEFDESARATSKTADKVIKDKDDLLDALRYPIMMIDLPEVVQSPRMKQLTVKPVVKYSPVTGSVIGYTNNSLDQFRSKWNINCKAVRV